jgi:alpha-galactosidase
MRIPHAPLTGRSVLRIALPLALLAAAASPHARQLERPAQYLDAFVEADRSAGEWTIGNSGIRYTIVISRIGGMSFGGLAVSAGADPVTVGNEPDALLTVGGETVRLGAADSGFQVEAIEPSTGPHFVALAIRFTSPARRLSATRHYVVFPGASAVEMWTDVAATDDETHTIENLNAYALTVKAGEIAYVKGLDAPESEGGSFSRHTRSLSDGERFDIGSPTLSSETDMPYFSLGAGGYRIISGLVWSGAWSASFERRGESVHVSMGLPLMSAWARPDHSIEGPHAFIGATYDLPGADVTAVTRFVRAGRAGREFPAQTTFNTWFVHGIDVNETILRNDIRLASSLGIELLQLDAGWYPHEASASRFDFLGGLGTYATDQDRFPDGLASLADYARENGVKFGLWVEPERVSLDSVGRPGLADVSFLAAQDGLFDPQVPNEEARDAQICLAEPAARAWVLARLTQLIDTAHPDNLKWDFNRWVHCTRPDHHHPANGGNYEHTRGLYEILSALRQRYPALTIENCSGGGHRLDFAMARLTDTAWMDDRTAPSAHVRRNLQGLLELFPAPYLFSYVMGGRDEPLNGAQDIPFIVRSRMPGVVGLATDLTELSEREANELNQQIELAKSLRGLQATAVTHVLTPMRTGPGEWEVVQQVVPDSTLSLIFAYGAGAPESIVVRPRGLLPELTYQLRSSDRGVLGHLRGADLIASGLEIVQAPESASQVLVLEATTTDGPLKTLKTPNAQTPNGQTPKAQSPKAQSPPTQSRETQAPKTPQPRRSTNRPPG